MPYLTEPNVICDVTHARTLFNGQFSEFSFNYCGGSRRLWIKRKCISCNTCMSLTALSPPSFYRGPDVLRPPLLILLKPSLCICYACEWPARQVPNHVRTTLSTSCASQALTNSICVLPRRLSYLYLYLKGLLSVSLVIYSLR